MRMLSIVTCAAALSVGLACSGLPPVSSPPPANALSLQAESSLPWSTRRSACQDATRRARQEARSECEVSSLTATHEGCECNQADSGSRAWHCSSQALYTCEARR